MPAAVAAFTGRLGVVSKRCLFGWDTTLPTCGFDDTAAVAGPGMGLQMPAAFAAFTGEVGGKSSLFGWDAMLSSTSTLS
jgi:hypothetical protein